MNRHVILFACLCGLPACVALPALAASGSAAHLKDGPGARWLGIGGAARAAAAGVGAVFWNPAGLTAQGPARWEAGSMLALAPYSRRTVMLSASRITDRAGTFGLGWLRHSVDGLERVDSAGNVIETASDTEDALEFSFGLPVVYQLRAGAALKYLRQALFDHTAGGAALSFGALGQPWLGREIMLAATIENVVSSYKWSTGRQDRLASGLGFGAAWRTWERRLLTAADIVVREGEEVPSYHAGVEVRPVPAAALRAGLDNGSPSGGVSYSWHLYEFHYGFTWNRAGLGDTHQTSLVLRFR